MTKISQLSDLGDNLAAGDEFVIRDISDVSTPNKKVTASGFANAVANLGLLTLIAAGSGPQSRVQCTSSGSTHEIIFTTSGTERLRINSAGQVASSSLGSAAAPIFTFSGDTNTGIYSPGADQVAVATNGTEKLIVLSNGNVGIGSSSPGAKLTVVGTSSNVISFSDNANYTVELGRSKDNTGSFGYIGGTGSTGLTLGSNNVEVIRITTVDVGTNTTPGNVGIGTTTPGGTLDIKAATSRHPLIVQGPSSEFARVDSSGRLLIGTVTGNANGGILQLTSGITFPATAVAATDVNTLDDYEEGTWTPDQGSGLTVVGTFSSSGRYTKVGNLVYVTGGVSGSTSIAISSGSVLCSNLIFTQALDGCGGNCTNYNVNQTAGLFATGGSTNLYATSALTASAAIFFGFTFRV